MSKPTLPTKMLTSAEVAEILSVTEDTVRRLARSGAIKAAKIGNAPNAILRFNPADLAALIERGPHHPAGGIQ